MKLLQSAASPFARKARVAVIESGLSEKVAIVPVVASMAQANPEIIAHNPLGKIPCLVLDDGSSLFDSRAVTRYLDAHGTSDLYPDGAWEVLSLESMGDGIMDCAVAMAYERRFRSADMVFEDYLGWQWEKISRTLDVLEQHWVEYLSSGLTAGHISVGCALGYLDLRHDERGWRTGRDRLSAWEAEFATRPSMAATVPTV